MCVFAVPVCSRKRTKMSPPHTIRKLQQRLATLTVQQQSLEKQLRRLHQEKNLCSKELHQLQESELYNLRMQQRLSDKFNRVVTLPPLIPLPKPLHVQKIRRRMDGKLIVPNNSVDLNRVIQFDSDDEKENAVPNIFSFSESQLYDRENTPQ